MTPLETLRDLLTKRDTARDELDQFGIVVEEIRAEERTLQDREARADREVHAFLAKLTAGDLEVEA